MARFSSWKVKPPTLRTRLAIIWLAASREDALPTRRSAALGATLHPEEAVGVEPQRPGAQVVQGVETSPITSRMPALVGSSQLIEG